MKYPEMVKTNARYRGPMESRKFNNSVLDIIGSIEVLKQHMIKNEDRGRSIQNKLFDYHTKTLPMERKTVVTQILSVKGGEL